METDLIGGWSAFTCEISDEAMGVFDEAVKQIGLGVNYEAVAVATQLVAGLNFAFFCNGKVVAPNTPIEGYMIYAYRNLDNKVELKGVEKVPGYPY